MRKVIIYLVIAIVVAVAIYYLFPRTVKIIDEYSVTTGVDVNVKSSWWYRVYSPETLHFIEDKYEVRLRASYFDEYDYYVSEGRRIFSLKYNLWGKIDSRSTVGNIYQAFVTLSKTWYPNTLYIYEVEKGKNYFSTNLKTKLK